MSIGPIQLTRKLVFGLLAGGLAFWAAWPFWHSYTAQGGEVGMMSGVGTGLLAAAKLILAGICFSIGFVDSISVPFTSFIDSVFGLTPDQRKPPLDFAPAERYLRQGMPDAADREFRRLLEYYPDSLKLWKRYLSAALAWEKPAPWEALAAEARGHFRFDRERGRKLQEHIEDLCPALLER